MSTPPAMPGPQHVHALVVGNDEGAEEMAADLDKNLGSIKVDIVPDATSGLAAIDAIVTDDPKAMVPLIIVMDSAGHIDDIIDAMITNPVGSDARFMLMTARQSHDDLARSIDSNRLAAIMSAPWSSAVVAEQAWVEIKRWLATHRPERTDMNKLVGGSVPETILPEDDLLARLELDGEELVKLLIDRIEKVLGPRPRIQLPPGIRLTTQDQSVDAVYVVLEGAVSLHRTTSKGEVLLHHASSGPIIGLVSFAQAKKAQFTARTTTTVTVVRLSMQQLEVVFSSEPMTSALLAVVAIKALARRLVRAEALHVENELLATQLEEEKEHLAQALKDLEEARAQLVGQARFAMLGELAAGIAHELNNPVAAIVRAADYVGSDIETLLAADKNFQAVSTAYTKARTRRPRSTADERALVRDLTDTVGDRALAKRLVKAEVDDARVAKKLAKNSTKLAYVEAGAGIGNSVRNIAVAADRITNLVASLRSYARPDDKPTLDVDVEQTVEETISLISHRVKDINLEREYANDLPHITAYSPKLTQVWTNLIVNAAEAIEESGMGSTICIRTEAIYNPHAPVTHPGFCQADASATDTSTTDADTPVQGIPAQSPPSYTHSPQTGEVHIIESTVDWVRVSFWDDGPGVDPKVLPHIFEPRFTTKSGTVRFGLGMGLGISRQIVENHGGFIFVDSRPGCTGFIVDLPIDGPPEDNDESQILRTDTVGG